MKIQLETTAKLHIQNAIRQNIYELVWSYMLDYENSNNPYEEKQNAIQAWKDIATHYCKSLPDILQAGKNIEKLGILSKDALHIACALQSKCDYFITTDLKLLKKKIDGVTLINPVDFVREVE